MKLKPIVINKISESKTCRNKLALEMCVHSNTIDRWLESNAENGKLTTAMAVSIISKEIKMDKSKLLTGE